MREAKLRRDCELQGAPRKRASLWMSLDHADPTLWWKGYKYDAWGFDSKAIRVAGHARRGGEFPVTIFNGCGTGYGDLVSGSVFIRQLYNTIASYGCEPRITLCPLAEERLVRHYTDVFSRDPHIDAIRFGAVPWEEFERQVLVMTTEYMVADPVFDKVSMVDYFFERCGLEGREEDMRPRCYPDPKVFAEVSEAMSKRKDKTIFVNFFGSGMRRFPVFVWEALVRLLLRRGWRVAVNAPNQQAAATVGRFINACFPCKPVSCIGELTSQSWSHYCAVIANCDGVVTTDTSSTHVAACYDIPCVTLFQFIDPALRIKHFPKCRGWTQQAFRKSKLWGRSHPYEGWTEEKHDEDPEVCRPWKKADLFSVVRLLEEVMN